MSQDSESSRREVISLDSDDDEDSGANGDDDDVQILSQPNGNGSTSLRHESARHHHHHSHSEKGERIVLHIRSNGERTDEVPIHMVMVFFVVDDGTSRWLRCSCDFLTLLD